MFMICELRLILAFYILLTSYLLILLFIFIIIFSFLGTRWTPPRAGHETRARGLSHAAGPSTPPAHRPEKYTNTREISCECPQPD